MDFEVQDCFEGYLTSDQRAFMVMLGVSGDFIPEETKVSDGRSRPGFQIDSFTRSFLAKNFFRIDSNASLRLRLQSKGNLKRRCGFTTVPSAATFSRRMKELSKNATMERVLNGLVKEYMGESITGHISGINSHKGTRKTVQPKIRSKAEGGCETHTCSSTERKKTGSKRTYAGSLGQLCMKPGKAVSKLKLRYT